MLTSKWNSFSILLKIFQALLEDQFRSLEKQLWLRALLKCRATSLSQFFSLSLSHSLPSSWIIFIGIIWGTMLMGTWISSSAPNAAHYCWQYLSAVAPCGKTPLLQEDELRELLEFLLPFYGPPASWDTILQMFKTKCHMACSLHCGVSFNFH